VAIGDVLPDPTVDGEVLGDAEVESADLGIPVFLDLLGVGVFGMDERDVATNTDLSRWGVANRPHRLGEDDTAANG
jgi:hypothetical protein